MTSFLIIHKDAQTRQKYAIFLITKEHIDPFDITIIEFENSLGIEDIRTIQKKIFLKPFKGEKKAIIVPNAHTATIEAQNALLKILEEPPAHTLFILTAESIQNFLPTIISRCTIIALDQTPHPLTDELASRLKEEFSQILSAPIGEKLKKAADIAADKADTLTWMTHMMAYLREDLLHNYEIKYVGYLTSFQKTYTLIQSTNVSTRFAIEDLLLNLS